MMQCKIATGLLIMGLSLITMPITAQEYVNCLEIPNTSPYEVMKCQQEQLRTFHKDNQKLRNDIKKLQAATAESNKAQIQMQSQIKKLRSQMPQDQQNGKYSLVIKSDTCSNRVWFADIETLPLGNIFLDIRANFTHCGGGCFWAFRHLQVLFNSYTHQHILSDINKHGNGAGKWHLTTKFLNLALHLYLSLIRLCCSSLQFLNIIA
ncbi:hypothetical protein TI05_10410 [Achromatium sp. WMS3]|nr:hypothetical protein TI05_10410 [Achromatium sp. WMS3]